MGYQRVDNRGQNWRSAGGSGEKEGRSEEVYLRAASQTPLLNEDSTVEEVDKAAVGLKEAMIGTLDRLARKKRW